MKSFKISSRQLKSGKKQTLNRIVGLIALTSMYLAIMSLNHSSAQTFSNSTDICPTDGNTTGNTSIISVSGAGTSLTSITVNIPNISHTYYDDLDIMLISPTGQRIILMSDCGGNNTGNGNRNYVFVQGGAALSNGAAPTNSGNVSPTQFDATETWPDGAATITAMNQFTGNPNGNWTLRVIDDLGGDTGCLIGGWSLTIVASTPSTAPSCTTNISPVNGATGISLTAQTLTWNAAATATGYDVYFGTTATPPLVSTNQAGTSYTTGALSGGTTYYWSVVTRNAVGLASGCSTWSFTTITPPANDLCSGATNLPCGTISLAGTTVNSAIETAPAGVSTSSYGVWYSFVGDGQQTTISSTAVFDHEMTVMTGLSCGSYTSLSSQDAAFANGTETYTFTTVNGQQYYVWIAHYAVGNTTTGTFTINRSCTPPPTPPANDLCSGAINLPCGTSGLAGTTVNSTFETAPGGGSLASPYGVWYTFTGDGGQTTISAIGNTFDIEMTIVSGSCGANTLVSSQDLQTTAAETYTFTTTNGTVYFVYIAYWNSTGSASNTGTFTISRSCVTPCTTPTTAGTLSANKTSTTVNDAVIFTTAGNAGTITKFEWSYDNFATVAGTVNNPANPYTLILNVQQPTMWFRTTSVNGACPQGVTPAVSVALQSAPPYTDGPVDGDYISNVTLNTINNNSTFDSPIGDGYQDFTSISTTLLRGATYSLSVSSPATFANIASGYSAWIDFNNNGIYEVSENVMQQAPATTRTQSFTVPLSAVTATSVKMRVLSVWAETPSTDAYYSLGYDWGEIEEYTIFISPSALPVELISFNANCNLNGDKVNVKWSTASEHNSSHFQLERSVDGVEWKKVYEVVAAGNSTVIQEYGWVDMDIRGHENIYYRLVQFDIDGQYQIYGPASSKCDQKDTEHRVYPNPSNGTFTIELNNNEQSSNSYNVEIKDGQGKIIYSKEYITENGNGQYTIGLPEVESGIYYLTISNQEASTQTIKLVFR